MGPRVVLRSWLAIGLLLAATSAATAAPAPSGGVVVWGCQRAGDNYGQCAVPAAARSGVVAISAGSVDNLALTAGGRVIAWGCRGKNFGQCTVPAGARSGVAAVAA